MDLGYRPMDFGSLSGKGPWVVLWILAGFCGGGRGLEDLDFGMGRERRLLGGWCEDGCLGHWWEMGLVRLLM